MNTVAFALIGTGLVGLLLAIWWIPRVQVQKYKELPEEKRAEMENDFRKTLIDTTTGLALVFSLVFTWAQLRDTQRQASETQKSATKQLQLAERQLAASQQDYLTRQFGSALSQFGDSTNAQVRLAGIFGLEEVANQAPNERMPILRTLTAFIRDARSSTRRLVPPGRCDSLPLPTTVQTALDVLRRQSWNITDRQQRFNRIDVSNSDMDNASLDSADLRWADFSGSHLRRATFEEASKLSHAIFRSAHLEDATFAGDSLVHADFTGASMCRAALDDAVLDSASFVLANLEHAKLYGASLRDANFDGADLSATEGLDSTQLVVAQVSTTTRLPPLLEGKIPRRPTNLRGKLSRTPCDCSSSTP